MTGQGVVVQSEICNLICFPMGFIFHFQRLFPVLEEGIFAENIALNRVSSLPATVLDPPLHLRSSTPSLPPAEALAQPQHTLRALEGLHIALASFSSKKKKQKNNAET